MTATNPAAPGRRRLHLIGILRNIENRLRPLGAGLRQYAQTLRRPAPVLPPYTPQRAGFAHALARVSAMSVVGFLCIVYGMAFGLFGQGLAVLFLVPIGILALLVIWALPDTNRPPVGLMGRLFFIATGAAVLWPNYLAIALPGLPWITVQRLVDIPMALVLLICLSISKTFRSKLATTLKAAPWVSWLMLTFFGFEVLSVIVSIGPIFSLDHFITAQISWTAMFVISAYVVRRKGAMTKWSRLLWACGLIIASIAFAEIRVRHPLWAGHIPSFLQINDPMVQSILEGAVRGTKYRAVATFDTALALGEFLALSLTFIVHETMTTKNVTVRIAGALSIPYILASELSSGSRSGIVGSTIALALYALLWLLRRRAGKGDIVKPVLIAFYPLGAVLFGAATFVVPALRVRMWNGGSSGYSDMARMDQVHLGIPRILHRPWGYGMAQAAQALQYYTPSGFLSIDSYYLSLFLEYGILGALVYIAMFACGAVEAGWLAIQGDDPDEETSFLVPVAISLVVFLVIKSVFAQIDNHALFFSVLGMVPALAWRHKTAQNPADAVAPARSPISAPRRPRGVPAPAYRDRLGART